MTDTELAYAATEMLGRLREDLTRDLEGETDPAARADIEHHLNGIPHAMFLLGAAAGKASRNKLMDLN